MDIKEAYQVMAKDCGIKIGDTVKVLRKAESYKMGWTDSWAEDMDEMICNEYVVDSIRDGKFFLLPAKFWLPFFVLEKVKPTKPVHNFKPFDRVLVRDVAMNRWRASTNRWSADLFSHYNDEKDVFVCVGSYWEYCIPYQGNEHLLGTTDTP